MVTRLVALLSADLCKKKRCTTVYSSSSSKVAFQAMLTLLVTMMSAMWSSCITWEQTSNQAQDNLHNAYTQR